MTHHIEEKDHAQSIFKHPGLGRHIPKSDPQFDGWRDAERSRGPGGQLEGRPVVPRLFLTVLQGAVERLRQGFRQADRGGDQRRGRFDRHAGEFPQNGERVGAEFPPRA